LVPNGGFGAPEVGDEMAFDVSYVAEISRSVSGKRRFVIGYGT
jgi:hypothetical protein